MENGKWKMENYAKRNSMVSGTKTLVKSCGSTFIFHFPFSTFHSPFSIWIFLLLFATCSVTFADFPAHFNTADESVQAELNRIYAQTDYRKALDALQQLKAKSGDALVPVDNQFIPLKYALSTGRNRPLTEEELTIYQARYETTAKTLLEQAVAQTEPNIRNAQLWELYRCYPCTKQGLTALVYLSEYFYQSSRFDDSLWILNQVEKTESYNKTFFPPEQLDARRFLCQLGLCSLLTGQELEQTTIQAKKSLAEFQQKYPRQTGLMGGKKVVLSEFLVMALERLCPIPADKPSDVTEKYKVDSSGLWRIPTDSTEPELIYEDDAPDSVKEQYIGKWSGNVQTEPGLIFAIIGTPNAYLNPNRRVPLELSNRLICIDTQQSDAVVWEKIPSSASHRWLAPLYYQQERLYIIEVKTTSNAYELTLVCLDASTGMELSRKWLLSTSQKPTVEYQSDSPFTFDILLTINNKTALFEINLESNEVTRLKIMVLPTS